MLSWWDNYDYLQDFVTFAQTSSAATLVYILIKLILDSTQINLELILHLISISKLSDGYKTHLPTKVLVIWAVVPTDFWYDKQIIQFK